MRTIKVKKLIVTMMMPSILTTIIVGCGAKGDDVSRKMIDDINALGEITLEDEGEINKLIDRYSTLTDSQKEAVKNYATLLDAQDEIESLKQEQASNQEKLTQEMLADENVQACLGIVRDIKNSLKHPDTLEVKKYSIEIIPQNLARSVLSFI